MQRQHRKSDIKVETSNTNVAEGNDLEPDFLLMADSFIWRAHRHFPPNPIEMVIANPISPSDTF